MTNNRDLAFKFFRDVLGVSVPSEQATGTPVLTVPPAAGADYFFCLEVHDEGARIVAKSCLDSSMELWDAHDLDLIGPEHFHEIILGHLEELLRHDSRVELRPQLFGVSSRLYLNSGKGWKETEGGFRSLFNRDLRRFARAQPDLQSPAILGE